MSTRVANPILVRQDEANVDDVAVATVQQEKRDAKAEGTNDAVFQLANIDVGATAATESSGQNKDIENYENYGNYKRNRQDRI
mmetsp:Transcript_16458/g.16298  ORF Transcript_16458/g.16298 Transcript_16458/m.16298 type:complete len:83 (+) Transcript_16458:344-592(+)